MSYCGGVLCYLFVLLTLFSASQALSNGICDYWLADDRGEPMNKVLASKGIQWSLHGVWNITWPVKTDKCMDRDTFLVKWHNYYQEGKLAHFIDASPLTEFTSCNHQYNEYKKHACKEGIPYQVWEDLVFDCLKTFNPDTAFVYRCQADHGMDCNRIEEIADRYAVKRNCKKGWPQCQEPHGRKTCAFLGNCNLWMTYKF